MNIWANSVITNKGLALQAKLIEGNTLTITRAVTGTGYVTPGLLQQQTEVSGPMQPLEIRPVTYPEEGKCALPCTLTNEGLTTGYTAMQLGIYANDPDEGEILYFIAQAETDTGTIIPAEDETVHYTAEWTFYFQYGHADNVTVVVDPSNSATIEMLEGKADVDFGNVTNEHFLTKATESGAALPIVTTEGTSEAYTANVPGMKELKVGASFILIPHVTSSTTMPTLNVNGLGTLNLRQELSVNNAATAPGALPTWLSAGRPLMVMYDGHLWKVTITRPSAGYLYGVVPIEKGGTGGENLEEARDNLGITDHEERIRELEMLVARLQDALFNNITSNPHAITFTTLDGLAVTGVWNEAKARMEC